MKVFNPNPVPVVVDDGAVVAATDHADIADGPMAQAAVERGLLLDQSAPVEETADKAPRAPKETR